MYPRADFYVKDLNNYSSTLPKLQEYYQPLSRCILLFSDKEMDQYLKDHSQR